MRMRDYLLSFFFWFQFLIFCFVFFFCPMFFLLQSLSVFFSFFFVFQFLFQFIIIFFLLSFFFFLLVFSFFYFFFFSPRVPSSFSISSFPSFSLSFFFILTHHFLLVHSLVVLVLPLFTCQTHLTRAPSISFFPFFNLVFFSFLLIQFLLFLPLFTKHNHQRAMILTVAADPRKSPPSHPLMNPDVGSIVNVTLTIRDTISERSSFSSYYFISSTLLVIFFTALTAFLFVFQEDGLLCQHYLLDIFFVFFKGRVLLHQFQSLLNLPIYFSFKKRILRHLSFRN